ncbi:MAG: hypothetical protein GX287_02745 [Fusobacteria bacterium]|nr:hypothetical protein [Fusobacteriota bacterium]
MKKVLCLIFIFLILGCNNSKIIKESLENRYIFNEINIIGFGVANYFIINADSVVKYSSFENSREDALMKLLEIIKKNDNGYFTDLLQKNNYNELIKNYLYNLEINNIIWDDFNNCILEYTIFVKDIVELK